MIKAVGHNQEPIRLRLCDRIAMERLLLQTGNPTPRLNRPFEPLANTWREIGVLLRYSIPYYLKRSRNA